MLRPPYILAHAADNAGCGTHRIMRPIEMLTKMGIAAGRCDMNLWPPEMLKQLNPDIVVWQRQHEDSQLATMKSYREALPGAFIVYELDDALGAVPDDSFHKPFIPIDVEARVAKAVELCDAVSVSTRAMAAYMRRICGEGIDVRIVPNMLGKDDFSTAAQMRKAHKKLHLKPRIGWGGGISHKGDLALIKAAVVATANEVEWVFLGMKPDVDLPVEFHEGVPPREYLAKLASLDLDLVVAPIEDNLFNRCKSNLRLIEAGACGYGVIASRVEPYLEKSPPVTYAAGDDDWIAKIREFIADGEWAKRGAERGAKLREWAEKHFCFESNGEERLKGWLPKGSKPFRSRQVTSVSSNLTIICAIPATGLELLGNVVSTAAEAYASSTDVLYLRPGTIIPRDAVKRLTSHLAKVQAASVSSLSNDGGLCGFPRFGEFSQIDPGHGQEIDAIAAKQFDGLDLDLPFPTGPMMLISRRAMNAVGIPEIGPDGSEEEMLVRWGMMASARGFRNKVAADVFVTAMIPKKLPLQQIVQREMMRWPPLNVQADPLPEIRARLEIEFHKACYLLPLRQQESGYDDWAAFFDSPGERDMAAMRSLVTHIDNPVSFGLLLPDEATVEPQAWSKYQNVPRETAVKSEADWFVFMWPGATLRSHALFEFAQAIRANPEARFIYADHDIITPEGVRSDHSFKPNFDHDLLLGRDYVSQICAIHRSMLPEGVIDDVAIYGVAIQLLLRRDPKVFAHVPRILAHLPPSSTPHEARMARRKIEVVNRFFGMANQKITVRQHPRFPQWGEVSFANNRIAGEAPLVSIIIPTKDKVEMLSPCLATVLEMTTYPNYEVLIIDNGSTRPEMVEYLNKARAMPRVRVIAWPFPYNWSKLNNFAAGEAKGTFLLLLNDDTRVIEPQWLDEMVGAASRPDVGAVGARLLYPHSLIQHVGVICQRGYCGHSLKGLPDGQPGYQGLAVLSHDATAVTGACLLIHHSLFEGAGRLDESLVHNFNDVALCLQLNRMGYRNVVAMRAQLQHYEGVTRTSALSPEGLQYLQAEAAILSNKFPEPDPLWNNNLVVSHMNGGATVAGLNYDQIAWPGMPWSWRGADWRMDRVLTVGDDDRMAGRIELGQGNVIYRIQVDGFSVRIVEPPLINLPACDIRETGPFKTFLDLIGIDRIVLRSTAGMPVEILGFLTRLDRPVEYAPNSAESLCPRRDMRVDNKSCGEGWRHGNCQACIDKHGSFSGFVSLLGWRHLWAEFLSRSELDVSGLGIEARTAVEHVFGGSVEPFRLPDAG